MIAEYVVDCQQFITCGFLAFTITALSSWDDDMRSAAYVVLNRYVTLLSP
jgi:hypothetical protein